MAIITLEETRNRIRSSKAGWKPGRTSVSTSIASDTHFYDFGFGLKRSRPKGGESGGDFATKQEFAYGGTRRPESVDWRDVNEADWTSEIADQSTCGSCVAFATCSALESRVRIIEADADHQVSMSEAHLFFCCGPADCDAGWTPWEALKKSRETGLISAADFPYTSPPDQIVCSVDRQSLPPIAKVDRWKKYDNKNENSLSKIKNALAKRGPVIAGMSVFDDFVYYKSGIYRPVSSDLIGLHAIVLVGYDDAQGCWIVQNSWSKDWGECGFGKIGYGTCGIGTEHACYDVLVDYIDTSVV